MQSGIMVQSYVIRFMVLRLSELWIYPIKSLGGIRCRQAMALEKGFEHDRRWMLVNEHNRFITQREHPQMALFAVGLTGNMLQVTHRKTTSSVQFETTRMNDRQLKVQIWDDVVDVYEVDEKISRWFSRELGFSCRLVKFPEEKPRPVDKNYVPDPLQVSLADGYPYLIIGQSSLDELNKRLSEPVTMHRFRPNLVFTGGSAFEEDQWKEFFIGNIRFIAVKPCARCILTTVSPETGEKGKEPLQTLSLFRRKNNNVYFGMNVVALTQGMLFEGDTIQIVT